MMVTDLFKFSMELVSYYICRKQFGRKLCTNKGADGNTVELGSKSGRCGDTCVETYTCSLTACLFCPGSDSPGPFLD